MFGYLCNQKPYTYLSNVKLIRSFFSFLSFLLLPYFSLFSFSFPFPIHLIPSTIQYIVGSKKRERKKKKTKKGKGGGKGRKERRKSGEFLKVLEGGSRRRRRRMRRRRRRRRDNMRLYTNWYVVVYFIMKSPCVAKKGTLMILH